MFSSIATASLLGLSCLSVVSAAPFSFANNPLGNNFPNPNPSQVLDIEAQAHGSLSNGPPPATVQPDTLTSLRFIQFNEHFEVAYFTELKSNITNNIDGYRVKNEKEREILLAAITAVQAQEELHVLNAGGALTHFGAQPIQPCQYNFPVDNLKDAIALASLFTDLVLGTLQDVASLLGSDGDSGLIRGITSVIGQEGEQNGFYRTLQQKIPSALPFLTTSTREFAFSALNQVFVVPGSCPNINTIDLPIFLPLTVDTTNIQPVSQNIEFSFELPAGGPKPEWGAKYEGVSLVYINQQNLPVVETLQNVQVKGNKVVFEAAFPFNQATFGNGLTIATIALNSGNLKTADGVAKAAVFGPGLIEIN